MIDHPRPEDAGHWAKAISEFPWVPRESSPDTFHNTLSQDANAFGSAVSHTQLGNQTEVPDNG